MKKFEPSEEFGRAIATIGYELEACEDTIEIDAMVSLLDTLHQVGILSAASHRRRLAGRIDDAMGAEKLVEDIYARLPQNCKW